MVALADMPIMTGSWAVRGFSLTPGGRAGGVTMLPGATASPAGGVGTSRGEAIPPKSMTVTGWRVGEKPPSHELLEREELEMLSKAAPTVVVCRRGRAKVVLPMETREDSVDTTEVETASVPLPPTTDKGCSNDEAALLYVLPLRVVAEEMMRSSCSDTGASDPTGATMVVVVAMVVEEVGRPACDDNNVPTLLSSPCFCRAVSRSSEEASIAIRWD